MKNINNVLKEYRASLGLSLDELSKITGVPKSTLSRYECNSNQKMDIGIVFEIAKALKIPKATIIKTFFSDFFEEDTLVKKPVVGRVCAGFETVADEEIIGYESIEPRYGTDEFFCLQVKGDSMSPRIDNGDIVLIKKQNHVQNGELAIVIVDNEDGLIKKVEYNKDCIKLIPFNLYYPERIFEKSDMNRVKIVGKVIESRRKW